MVYRIRRLIFAAVMATALLVPVCSSSSVYAVDLFHTSDPSSPGVCDKNPDTVVCKDATSGKNPLFGPNGVITLLVKILSVLVGVIAVFIVIFQAIRIITSNGDSQSVNTARNGIIYAVVGLVIAALAQAIVAFVLNKVKS